MLRHTAYSSVVQSKLALGPSAHLAPELVRRHRCGSGVEHRGRSLRATAPHGTAS
jgi:hypothetical protein